MSIVTGVAGFIDSNIVKTLNQQGRTDILAVDDLTDGAKALADCDIQDYMDKDEFITCIVSSEGFGAPIEVIYHEGVCSDTTEWDGKMMMDNIMNTLKTSCIAA